MRLHPAAEPGEPFVAPTPDEIVAQRADRDRAAPAEAGPPAAVDLVEDRRVGDVPVRRYVPHGIARAGSAGAIVYLHGGGWVYGSLETVDGACRRLADRSGATVLSVDYRLSPEATWPAAIDDGDRVLAALAGGGSGLPTVPAVEHDRVVVAGDSAGGFLATVLARRARDDGRPVAGQALVYPVVRRGALDGLDGDVGTDDGLSVAAMRWFWEQFLGADEPPAGSPDADPMAADLAGLPPCLLLTAEHDVLCAEGEAYAGALQAAGVEVVAGRWLGLPHGFFRHLATFPAAAAAVDHVAAWCHDLLAR